MIAGLHPRPGERRPPVPPPAGPARSGEDRRSRTSVRAAGLLLGAASLLVAGALSLSVGTKQIPLDDVWKALFSPTGTENDAIVRDLRLPRTLIGAAVGAALGLGGGLMQTLTRNPLADPGLLGVNAGAAAAVVTAISVLGVTSFTGYLWFALAGAALAATAVQVLGGGRFATPVRLALAGTAVNAALFGYVNGLQQWDLNTLDEMRFWSVGSLAKRDTDLLLTALPLLVAGTVLALALARPLGALALGDDHARALGTRVRRTRVLSVLAITLLCGAATALCGPIGFVGLMIPHAARAFCGPDPRRLLPFCALFAPVLLLVSDVLGRIVVPPSEIEVGTVTAFLGGLLFIHLVRRRKVAQL
ncbi:iron chelate uptake ABC transporter family permease subunit [Streptomyces phaeoluteigriseus]|uniref:Iron chelate uptake ABC transporter family permease subunit n=1 Tax=Streptomyces phaeoluteigriseus TaxID=114686 RepID=A0ABY4Z7P6_9ACTN|nr:iron chelate uptake ABC transporter family permease subunit [Streptomyces phaeoluteigriseus]USQ85078.1 iron chelate uptake ABC transporter family permease subunit [Streptomyces phaeoluteigriseus]